MENEAWMYKADPQGSFEPEKCVELRKIGPVPKCPEGSMLLKLLATAVSPQIRCRMKSGKSETCVQKEFGWWQEGEIFPVEIIGEVLESRARGYAVGDRVTGLYPLQRFLVVKADGSDTLTKFPPSKVPKDAPLEKCFSALSFSGGISAYMAIQYMTPVAAAAYALPGTPSADCCFAALSRRLMGCCPMVGDARYAGKVAVVTTAASSVGMVAGQLYKYKGCKKVIGVTSTRSKADQLLELGGFDATIAYKSEDLETRLRELAPEGVDIDFEMAGGPQLDAVLRCMNKFGKVVLCGIMHDSNSFHGAGTHGCKEYGLLVGKSIDISGFFVADYFTRVPFALMKMKSLVKSGKVKTRETTIQGFENWAQAVNMVLHSGNFGRLVLLAGTDGAPVPSTANEA